MRRQLLTEAQIATLFDPPTDRREYIGSNLSGIGASGKPGSCR